MKTTPSKNLGCQTAATRRTRALVVVCLLLGSLARPQSARAAGLCYVDINAGGSPDGKSWATAFTDLQSALTDPACTEVWVADGFYFPGALRSVSFFIPSGMAVYGGFAGGESVQSQRDPAVNLAVLSGDIDGNDTNADGNGIAETTADIQGGNSYHVVTLDGTDVDVTAVTVLDGFTITAADGEYPNYLGGGLFCNGSGSGNVCSPTLANLTFSGNNTDGYGGGIDNYAYDGGTSSPSLTNITFTGNSAGYGGAMFNDGQGFNSGGTSSPTLVNVTFRDNTATGTAGAMFNQAVQGGTSTPSLTNVTFEGNTSGNNGGAMLNNGADNGVSSPVLKNVTFTGNTSGSSGGAIYNGVSNTGTSSPQLVNVTITDNHSDSPGGAIYNNGYGGTLAMSLINTIVWGDGAGSGSQEIEGGTPSIDYSVIDGGCASILGAICGGANLSTNPLLGPMANNGGYTRTMALMAGSSAIDAGNLGPCPIEDQRGISRPRGPHCDIGAYERILPPANVEGDYASDLGYFHASTGLWAALQSSTDFSYSSPFIKSWGQAGDLMVRGDFDGDWMLDPAVRRPPGNGQSAAYLILLSTTNYSYNQSLVVPAGWPGLGDTPVVGDWNGDGIDEPAIWRGNSGVWIIEMSPSFNVPVFYAWGQSGDTPVGADVDGDSQTDLGYWRPSTGVWGFLLSSEGYSYASPQFFSWGASTDIAMMHDYDGDGKADPAVVIPPSGGQSRAYRILLSTLGYDTTQSLTVPAGWPGLGDMPVPNDYDGDGKADAGIWRGNTGVWIIPKSSTNNTQYLFRSWGTSGDQPVK